MNKTAREKVDTYIEAIYKEAKEKKYKETKDDLKRDKDVQYRVWRDGVKPELKRGLKSLPATMAGGAIGGVVGGAIGSATGKADKGAALGSIIGGNVASYKKSRKMEKEELNRLSRRYLGKDANKTQHDLLAGKNIAARAMGLSPKLSVPSLVLSTGYTPESVIQGARRKKLEEKTTTK